MVVLVKNQLRRHIKLTQSKTSDNIKYWEGFGKTGTLTECQCHCKIQQLAWKPVCQFLIKLNKYPTTQQSHLCYLPRGKKTYGHTKNPNARIYKSILHTSKTAVLDLHYGLLAIKMKELLINSTVWLRFRSTTLCKRSQTRKTHIYYMISLIGDSKIGTSVVREIRSVVSSGQEQVQGEGADCKGVWVRRNFWWWWKCSRSGLW